MSPDEIKFFLKYIWKEITTEVVQIFKAITNLARPKLWLFIFTIILIYQLTFVRKKFEVILTLAVLIFIWLWESWESGHWKAEMRKEFVEKVKKEKKKDL